MNIRPHRRVLAVEPDPVGAEEGIDPGGAARVVWYVSGRGVCRPAVYHWDDTAGVWVRGAACESVVDGGVFVQPTYGGRVEIRLVHLKLAVPAWSDEAAGGETEAEPWLVNYRLLGP